MAQIKARPGHFSLCGEGSNAGRDGGQPVTCEYESPNPCTAGVLHEVVLDRSGDPSTDMERHLAAAFARPRLDAGAGRSADVREDSVEGGGEGIRVALLGESAVVAREDHRLGPESLRQRKRGAIGERAL